MPRPAKFSEEQILDAAAQAVGRRGRDATIADVAAALDAPVGSLYYRFASREALMISLWTRSIRRFHQGLLAAAAPGDPDEALIEGALHVPRFCRSRPVEALCLTLYRYEAAVRLAPPSCAPTWRA